MQGRLQITHGSSPPHGLGSESGTEGQEDEEHRSVEVSCEYNKYSISQIASAVNRLLVLSVA
jgi:hypothetical protein